MDSLIRLETTHSPYKKQEMTPERREWSRARSKMSRLIEYPVARLLQKMVEGKQEIVSPSPDLEEADSLGLVRIVVLKGQWFATKTEAGSAFQQETYQRKIRSLGWKLEYHPSPTKKVMMPKFVKRAKNK